MKNPFEEQQDMKPVACMEFRDGTKLAGMYIPGKKENGKDGKMFRPLGTVAGKLFIPFAELGSMGDSFFESLLFPGDWDVSCIPGGEGLKGADDEQFYSLMVDHRVYPFGSRYFIWQVLKKDPGFFGNLKEYFPRNDCFGWIVAFCQFLIVAADDEEPSFYTWLSKQQGGTQLVGSGICGNDMDQSIANWLSSCNGADGHPYLLVSAGYGKDGTEGLFWVMYDSDGNIPLTYFLTDTGIDGVRQVLDASSEKNYGLVCLCLDEQLADTQTRQLLAELGIPYTLIGKRGKIPESLRKDIKSKVSGYPLGTESVGIVETMTTEDYSTYFAFSFDNHCLGDDILSAKATEEEDEAYDYLFQGYTKDEIADLEKLEMLLDLTFDDKGKLVDVAIDDKKLLLAGFITWSDELVMLEGHGVNGYLSAVQFHDRNELDLFLEVAFLEPGETQERSARFMGIFLALRYLATFRKLEHASGINWKNYGLMGGGAHNGQLELFLDQMLCVEDDGKLYVSGKDAVKRQFFHEFGLDL
ncbi:MAG: hypothetical protein LKE40_02990 [Spirochaetia bacterium]|jgi:hypothetical protein|nr:hypothetical protein [Spirochaetia bacterium]